MKIAIISDTHDNIPNIEKALQWINKEGIKTIIHCGDLCAPSILYSVIEPNFTGQLYMVHGNVSDKEAIEKGAEKYKNVKIFDKIGEFKTDDLKIAFCHFPKEAKELAQTGQYDYIFYGHTHRPWEESYKLKAKSCKLVNPGTLAGMFYKATFAVLDIQTNKLELKILEKI